MNPRMTKIRVLIGLAMLGGNGATWAAATSIADVPLGQINSVAPNIMFVLDSSGSMAWTHIPDIGGTFPYPSTFYTMVGYKNNLCNPLYYNPNYTYTPGVTYTGTDYAAPTYTAACNDPYSSSSCTVNLSTTFLAYTTTTSQMYNGTAGGTDPNTLGGYYYQFNGSGQPTNAQCQETTGTSANSANFTRVLMSSATSAQKQNFANWYSFYRTRSLMMKTVTGQTFHQALDPTNNTNLADVKFRVGYTTISLTNTTDLLGVNYFYSAHKQSWYTKLYHTPTSGSTTLRDEFIRVGDYFKQSGVSTKYASLGDPILPQTSGGSCQQNYAILTTDGYWNDSPAVSINVDNVDSGYSLRSEGVFDGGGSYSTSNTLSDIALNYYMNDLRPSLPNLVTKGVKDTQCNSVFSGVTYCHQHLKTHSIGLAPGTMYFRPDYEVAIAGSIDPAKNIKAPGNFVDIKNGATKCSSTGAFKSVDPVTGVESGGGTSVCNWPAPSAVGIPANVDDLWHAAVSGRGKFYLANDPNTLKAGLTTLLNSVVGASQTTGASLSTPTLVPTDSLTFSVVYNPTIWSGEISAVVLDPITGQPVTPLQTLWTASGLFDTMIKNGGTNNGWDVKRKIVTHNGSTGGIPFRYASMTAAQKVVFDGFATVSPASNGTDVVNFLRGDMSKEGTAFRDRGDVSTGALGILGDIVNSKPQVVDEPDREYADAGYADYKSTKATRSPVLYVGANDGMLHAFDASANYVYKMDFPKGCDSLVPGSCSEIQVQLPHTHPHSPPNQVTYTKCTIGTKGCTVQVTPNSTSGQELWAYVPNLIIQNGTSGMGALSYGPSNTNPWKHKFYVDGNPVTADVDFNNTCANSAGGCTKATPYVADWRTILVGGLNKGGKGYYALDVTDPTASNETTVATKVLWEFNDPTDMGYSYADPIVAKTHKYGWVVIIPSGYGNSSGKGFIYVLDAKTGALLHKMSWSSDPGTPTTPTDLGKLTGYTFSARDLTVEQLYGGDMQGRIWRVDISGNDLSKWVPGILATLKDSSGNPQPITTTPWIEVSLDTNKRYVLAGTGRWLDSPDFNDNQNQTIYAIVDGDNKSPRCSTGNSTPNCTTPTALVRGDLTSVPYSSTNAATVGSYGWYTDLQAAVATVSGAERVTVDPKGALGYGAWAIKVPNLDPCAPSSAGALFMRKLDDASSAITNAAGTTINRATSAAEFVLVGIMKTLATPAGATKATVGFGVTNTQGATTVVKIPLKTRASRFSWREILD